VVRDFMSTEVETVRPNDMALEAAKRLLQSGFSSLPVIDDEGRVVGILSEADLLRLGLPTYLLMMTDLSFLPPEAEFIDSEGMGRLVGMTVRQVMQSRILHTVEENTALATAALLMLRHHVRRLPVLRDGKFVGIINRSDLVRAMIRITENHEVS